MSNYYLGSGKFKITSGFGMREHPVHGGRKMHNGVDLAAPKGTPIIAAMDGIVEAVAFQKGGAGWYVKIKHSNGLETVYMHMNSKSPLKVGQRVSAGQSIGVVGATGAATGPHLHFEVRQNGKAINPMPFLKGYGFSGGGGMGGGFRGLALSHAPSAIRSYIDAAHKKYGVKPQLIAAIIQAESNFKINAYNRGSGATGLMQLIPAYHGGSKVRDPRYNVMRGTEYIRGLLRKYGDVRFALAAYNWGPGNMDKMIQKYGKNWSKIVAHLPNETRRYVPKVLGYL